jgi:hypothetical protein
MSDQPSTSLRHRIAARLEENPLLLVWGGSAGFAVLLIVVVLVIVLSSVGGDNGAAVSGDPTPSPSTVTPTPTQPAAPSVTPAGDTTPTPTVTPVATVPAIDNVAPQLDSFGDLAAVHSQSAAATFGSTSASLLLPDDVAIDVPGGAFPVPTELRVALVDLLFGNYLINPPQTRIYILSTNEDVTLNQPAALVIPASTDAVTVSEFVGSGWIPVDVPSGTDTRIEISHLSERTIAVTHDSPGTPQIPLNSARPQGFSPWQSFTTCLTWISEITLSIPPTLAIQVCWEALERILEPTADEPVVDVGCLSDEIGSGPITDVAISVCTPLIIGPTAPPPSQTAVPTAAPTPTPQSGVIAQGTTTVEPVLDSCDKIADDEPIQCSYTLNVSMDYEVTALPARIGCRIRDQIPAFSPLVPGVTDLTELSGFVTVSPRAAAQFDPPDSPRFSLPTLVECFLQMPAGDGTFRDLDSVLVAVSLPGPEL